MLTVTIHCFVWRSYPGWSEELLNEPMLCSVRDMEWAARLHDECKVVTYAEGPQLNFQYFFLREKQAKICCSNCPGSSKNQVPTLQGWCLEVCLQFSTYVVKSARVSSFPNCFKHSPACRSLHSFNNPLGFE